MKNFTLSEAREALLNKTISSCELVKYFFQRIKKHEKWNAYITLNEENALKQAIESDKKIANGTARPLEGIPLAIKDLFLTKDILTTAGSKMLSKFIAPYESTVTQHLLDDGAIFLGKTNMDEFAMGSANFTSYYGRVINPWSTDKDLTPGGSSGGSAAAVAGDLCLGATGSDTGGSIRQPAAFSGIVGLKATYSRCSRFGMVAFASSLDQAGPMTKSVKDAAIMLKSMAGYDKNDATSADVPVPDFESFCGKSIAGMRIGIPQEYKIDGMSPDIQAYWEKTAKWLEDAGAKIVSISLKYTKYALPTYYIIAPAEASSNLARYDGVRYTIREYSDSLNDMYEKTRAAGFGQEVKRRILIGTYVLSSGYYDAYYTKALKVRKLIADEFNDVFQNVDLILAPTTPTTAFAFDEEPKDPVTMYLNDILTVTVNMAGLPAISVPVGLDRRKRPIGMQLIAKHFMEQNLIQAGSVIEAAATQLGTLFTDNGMCS